MGCEFARVSGKHRTAGEIVRKQVSKRNSLTQCTANMYMHVETGSVCQSKCQLKGKFLKKHIMAYPYKNAI